MAESFLEKINKSGTFVIAEIGQNHQGSVETAKELIKKAKECGADCIKFQKTNISEKFNKAALNRPYNNKNSWGTTYGAHKSFLEFSNDKFEELQQYALEKEILFSASAMDLISLNFLYSINVPFIKIGSGDANNFILIEAAAKLQIPLIISTGMQNLETVDKIYNMVSKYHNNFCLMHCVSSYPTPAEDINLNVIKLFKERYSDIIIGYSGHELGTDISVAAVTLGAKIIERHFTFDRTQKGSDHVCSLEPHEFKNMVQKIKLIEKALGKPEKKFQTCELPCYQKLGKSVVAATYIPRGTTITEQLLKVKVAEPKGVDASLLDTLIGKVLKKDINEDDSIVEEYFV